MKQKPTSLILLFLFGLINLEGQISINDILIQQQEDNVLRYDISFTTSKKCNAYIEYITTGEVTYHSNVSLQQEAHQLTLVGLKAETEYLFAIQAFNEEGDFSSPIQVFEKSELP